jgi:hypothetical protein
MANGGSAGSKGPPPKPNYNDPGTGANNRINIGPPPTDNSPYSDPTGSPSLTVVNTDSLASFSQFVSGQLTDSLSSLTSPLEGVQVKPGAFTWGDWVRANVAGIASGLSKAVNDHIDGMNSIVQGLTQLSQVYTDTEELNKAKATNIDNAFSNAGQYFNRSGADATSPNIKPAPPPNS